MRINKQSAKQLGCLISLITVCTLSTAQNKINSITTSLQEGKEVIRIDFEKPVTELPKNFLSQTPPRISLDFPNVTTYQKLGKVAANQSNLKSIDFAETDKKSRLVLNLSSATTLASKIEDKSLFLTLESQKAIEPTGKISEKLAATSDDSEISPIGEFDFKISESGGGRLTISLNKNNTEINVRQQGLNLVAELSNSSIPQGMPRKMDVTEFGTPVKRVSLSDKKDKKVEILIEPTGMWSHTSQQKGNQFIIEITPIAEKIDMNETKFTGKKLSFNFQNIEVRSILQVIADFTKLNIITSDAVTGTLTMRLEDIPWDQALDVVLKAKGLGMKKNGAVIWVAPLDELAAREKHELEAASSLVGIEPLKTQNFQLNYTKAADIANQLTAGGSGTGGATSTAGAASAGNARLLSTRGSVIAESRTNQLFVTDVASKLEQVQKLIKLVDIPVRQVLIEARIVEASDTFSRSLGMKLGGGITPGNPLKIGSKGGVPVNATLGSSYAGGPGSATQNDFVNMPAQNLNGYNAAQFALSLFNADASRFLNLEISALEADGKGQVVSSPRVVTADQIKALIEQGTELPYQTASSSGATTVAFRKANLKLEVTPQITPEGGIILALDVNKDTVGQSTAAGFAINTKHVQTQVLVENGGTVVIGGIFEITENNDVTKVPLLGDIPAVGNFFKNTVKTTSKQEMLIFITPKIISEKSIK